MKSFDKSKTCNQIFNVSQTRNAPRQWNIIVCYTCGIGGHMSAQSFSQRQRDWGQGIYPFQNNQNNTNSVFDVISYVIVTH